VLHGKGALFSEYNCMIKVGDGTELVWKRAIEKWHEPCPIPTTPFEAFVIRKPPSVRLNLGHLQASRLLVWYVAQSL